MAMTREDMLRELELLPAWKLREPALGENPNLAQSPVVTAEVQPEVKSVTQATFTEIVSITPDIEMPKKIEVTGSIQGLENITVTAVPESDIQVNIKPDINPIVIEDKVVLLEARINAIKTMDWQALQDCVNDYQAGNLATTRVQNVFGAGDPNAEWLIVGEAPGEPENLKDESLVDDAAKLLDNMLAAIQLKRSENVFITNLLKCFPPENRGPHNEEVLECDIFLQRQVELIKPKLIIALGNFAAQSLLQLESTIDSLRGQLHTYKDVPVIVTYHPAYLLRNPADKAKAWEDLCFAKKTMQNL